MAGKRSTLREYVEAALWALVLTLFLRAFVLQAFRIPSESMLNTLLVGDFLFVNKLDYGPKIPLTDIRLPGFAQPRPGDVIVFQSPEDTRIDLIKRCVATAGQTVEMRNKDLFVDGQKRVEPYVIHIDPNVHPANFDQRDNYGPFTVPPDDLFMMGDKRDNSDDRRLLGTVPMELVKGRARFFYLSWDSVR